MTLITLMKVFLAITISNTWSSNYDLDPITAMSYAYWIADASAQHNIDPIWPIVVIAYESKWDPEAVLPGCPKRGKKPMWCNRDGRPDAGLFQLRVGASWLPQNSMGDLLDPRTNIYQGVMMLAAHRRAHTSRGCERQKSWHKKWTWSRHAKHHWIQHNNMGSRGYGERLSRRYRDLKSETNRAIHDAFNQVGS